MKQIIFNLDYRKASETDWYDFNKHFATGWGGGYELEVYLYKDKVVAYAIRLHNGVTSDLYYHSDTKPCGEYGFDRTYRNQPIPIQVLGVKETAKGLVLVFEVTNKYNTIHEVLLTK